MSLEGTALSRHGDIIIVRRRQDEDEGGHSGTWKIAFADFMTALMAFFLVMWLTNASDDATKKQIAQYFNPIKLNSSSPPTPGVSTTESSPVMRVPQPLAGSTEAPGVPEGKPVGGSETGGEDQAIFRDPYAVLAEIVAEGGPGTQNGRSEPVPDGTGLPGLNGGEAYRDPFDPSAWQLQPNIEVKADEAQKMEPSEFTTLVTEVAAPAAAPAPLDGAGDQDADADPVPAPVELPAAEVESTEAEKLEAEILQSAAEAAPGASAGIEVSQSEAGIVISLADSLQNGMFEIGSARPSAETIRLIEEIAQILSQRPGTIVIRGHTDARPYAGEDYDNWRLSTARAHMAYYMLLRGGLAEDRVKSIEGFADRQLKEPNDPEAAANRRIEILLREGAA